MAFGDAGAHMTALGSSAAAALAFRSGPELRVVAVVKATFAFVQDRPMAPIDPDPLVRADVYREGSASSCLVSASDLAPYRPLADVLLVGRARAPRGLPVPAMPVRLVVSQGSHVVLDKRLALRGSPNPSGRTREPLPFAVMPLTWELARRTPENPVGIAEDSDEWPHIVDGASPDRAAGFGPISPRWPSRRRLLTQDERLFSAPIPALPADFAWSYFNVAPEDQRIPFLRGDEWIGVEGTSAEIPRVQSCLPTVRAAARVFGVGADPERSRSLRLDADTLVIDADRQVCSVVWRGSFPIESADSLPAIEIFAGAFVAGSRLTFPTKRSRRARPPQPPVVSPAAPDVLPVAPPPAKAPVRTLAITAVDLDSMAARRPVTPFEAARAAKSQAPPAPANVTVAPVEHPVFIAPPPASEVPATLDVSRVGPSAPLPFAIAPPAEPDAPRGPLLPATPFEHANLPPPPASEAPMTLDLRAAARPIGPAPLPVAYEVMPSPRVSPPPEVVLSAPRAEPPKTLGQFFLAALARTAP